MARFRFRGVSCLILLLAVSLTQMGSARPQSYSTGSASSGSTSAPAATYLPYSAERSYKIYSLSALADDVSLGLWISQTIPEMIAAGSWKAPNAISYQPSKNILLVRHSPEVQAKVEEFLADVKKSLPKEKKAKAEAKHSTNLPHDVMPAGYTAPGLLKATGHAPEPTLSYPVPAPVKAPKHLFHFIIRYEGEGIIDDSVVKAMKTYCKAQTEAGATPTVSPATARAIQAAIPAQEVKPPQAESPNAGQTLLPAEATPPTKFASEKEEGKKDSKDKKDKEKKKEQPEER